MTIGERQFTIGARPGVLINAGGFAQNSRMRSRYMADGSTRWSAAGASDSSAMIEEMQWAGAAVAQIDRKSVVEGKSVYVRVDLGGRRRRTKKNRTHNTLYTT